VSRLRGLAALASLLAAAPALAFVRSVAQDTNVPLSWKTPRVTFVVNPNHFNSIPGCASAGAAMALVRASFPAWNEAKYPGGTKVCTSFQFVDGGDSQSTTLGYTQGAQNENLVVFRSGLCSAETDPACTNPPKDAQGLPELGACIQKTNCWEHDATIGAGGTIALTTVTYDPSTGEILDADMELHDWNGDANAATGWYFTCPGPPAPTCSNTGASLYSEGDCIYIDVGNTVTHEAGHMLGLDHCKVGGTSATACPNSGTPLNPEYPVMAPTAATGDTDKRTLKPDDIVGVCTIYPVKDTAGGGCGCGTASASGLALLGLFVAALRPRRRSAQ